VPTGPPTAHSSSNQRRPHERPHVVERERGTAGQGRPGAHQIPRCPCGGRRHTRARTTPLGKPGAQARGTHTCTHAATRLSTTLDITHGMPPPFTGSPPCNPPHPPPARSSQPRTSPGSRQSWVTHTQHRGPRIRGMTHAAGKPVITTCALPIAPHTPTGDTPHAHMQQPTHRQTRCAHRHSSQAHDRRAGSEPTSQTGTCTTPHAAHEPYHCTSSVRPIDRLEPALAVSKGRSAGHQRQLPPPPAGPIRHRPHSACRPPQSRQLPRWRRAARSCASRQKAAWA